MRQGKGISTLRRGLSLGGVLVLGLSTAAPALGYVRSREAVWRVSVSATFSTDGRVTNDRCIAGFDEDDRPIYRSLSGSASERATLRTTRSANLYVQQDYGDRAPFAVSEARRPLLATVTRSRSSALEGPEEPRDCRRGGPPTDPPDCGTRTLRYDWLVGRRLGRQNRWAGLGFATKRPPSAYPDPFGNCWLVSRQSSFPLGWLKDTAGTAPVDPSRLSSRSRQLTVRGERTWTTRDSVREQGPDSPQYTATATHAVRWRATLVRLSTRVTICDSYRCYVRRY